MIQEKRLTFIAKVCFCLLALSLLLVLAACGGSPAAATTNTPAPTVAPTDTPTTAPTVAPTDTPTTASTGSGNSVTITNFTFGPASLTVKVGTKVTWTNNDSVPHTVTADQGAFDSNTLPVGQSFSFTFTKAGTYSYHCNIHPSMKATIVVQ